MIKKHKNDIWFVLIGSLFLAMGTGSVLVGLGAFILITVLYERIMEAKVDETSSASKRCECQICGGQVPTWEERNEQPSNRRLV